MPAKGIRIHSPADWDFQTPTWELSPAHFISPPTALHCLYPDLGTILCRLADAQALSEARLISSFYNDHIAGRLGFVFRNQAALDAANYANTYMVLRQEGNIFFIRWEAGVATYLVGWADIMTLASWIHFRLTFWNGLTPALAPALCVQLEYKTDAHWFDLGIRYDVVNQWNGNPVNRVGLTFQYDKTWCDNTEIWILP